MARGDGVHRTNARNAPCKRGGISAMERHNERKNESYENPDIQLERSSYNVIFKSSDEGYLATFDRMVEEGTISTRGGQDDQIIMAELVFDVNTLYFEELGGYEAAKEFYEKAYEYAIKKLGDERYILSAVMHADERNSALSTELGKDVYHYHLHVVYIPVVEKEIKWTKRCKNPDLVGEIKCVINQVSHSKKWQSTTEKLPNGKVHLVKSYSSLQDEFFQHMKDCGYANIQRGEKGTNTKHLKNTEFKVMKEQAKLEKLEKQVHQEVTALEKIDNIETKEPLLDKSKVTISKADFNDLKKLAKKQVVADWNTKKLKAELKDVKAENQSLHTKNQTLEQKVSSLGATKTRMEYLKLKQEHGILQNLFDKVMEFIDKFGLREKLEAFLYPERQKGKQHGKDILR